MQLFVAQKVTVVNTQGSFDHVIVDGIYSERKVRKGDICIARDAGGELVITANIRPDKFGVEIWGVENGKIETPNFGGVDFSAAFPPVNEIVKVGEDERRTYFSHPNFPCRMWIWNRNAYLIQTNDN